MAVFTRWKLNENGSAEYRQAGSRVAMRCSEGLWDGEAPLEIEVKAANLAPVSAKQPKADEPGPAKKAAKGKK